MAQEKIRTNLFVNFIGKGWVALMTLVATPIYVRLLGIESYGLIGFYTALTSFFYLFDFGMGDTLCRETARLFSQKNDLHELRNTLRTLEVFYWAFGALLTCGLYFAAPWVSSQWFHDTNAFSNEELTNILRLMSLSFFFQWPFLFYCKGLQGLQAHIPQNSILFIGSAFRNIGAVVILLVWAPSIEHFFYWQIFSTCLQTMLALIFIWKKVSLFKNVAHFSLRSVKRIWKFSLGMSLIGITSVILLQADKLIVSRMFSLELLGYYCLAYSIGSSLYFLLQPIISVYYPLFVQCIEKDEQRLLKSNYHTASQLVGLLVVPCAILLIFFAQDLIFIWTRDHQTASNCAPILSILACGILLNACMCIPYLLQIASGWTSLTLSQNILSVCVLVPALFVLSKNFGLIGVASFFVLLNLGYLGCIIPLLHRKLLIGERNNWYRNGVIIPFAAGCTPATLAKFLFGDIESMVSLAFSLGITFCLIVISVAVFTPLSRQWLIKQMRAIRVENG